MLEKLIIKNYVLIEELELDLSEGLNILTGETGAGKSIILSALQMATGARADLSVFLDREKKCIVELHYDISKFKLRSIFSEQELDYEDKMIVRREILPSGKSRSFINDSVTSLQTIKFISSKLVDFHKQFDNMEVQNLDFHREVIDVLANNENLIKSYQESFQTYSSKKLELNKLTKLDQGSSRDLDFISFQLDELTKANLDANEKAEKEESVRMMSAAEELNEKFSLARKNLFDDEHSALEYLRQINLQISPLSDINNQTKEYSKRIESLLAELEDLSYLNAEILDQVEYDPKALQENQDRLSDLYRLEKKYNANSIEELLIIQQDLSNKIKGLSGFGERIEQLNKEIEKCRKELRKKAKAINASRVKVIPKFEKQIIAILETLAFKNIQFKVQVDELEEFEISGTDQIEFLFSANKGKAPQSLFKIASGGEISRLMLSIKSVIADNTFLPTLVFDEIDTGISGDVAMKTGKILKDISGKHQIISITHSPQVASRADTHFKIFKTENNNQTVSKMEVLEGQDRLIELATMLSGSPPSESAIQNARELTES